MGKLKHSWKYFGGKAKKIMILDQSEYNAPM